MKERQNETQEGRTKYIHEERTNELHNERKKQ